MIMASVLADYDRLRYFQNRNRRVHVVRKKRANNPLNRRSIQTIVNFASIVTGSDKLADSYPCTSHLCCEVERSSTQDLCEQFQVLIVLRILYRNDGCYQMASLTAVDHESGDELNIIDPYYDSAAGGVRGERIE